MAIQKTEILKYLADVRAHYAAYHNHKETMAWAGVVLYLALMTQVLIARSEVLQGWPIRVSLAFAAVILMIAALVYLNVQFFMRRTAANVVAACIRLSSEYVGREGDTIQADWDLQAPLTGPEYHTPILLPKVLKEKADEMDKVGQEVRISLERCGRTFVLVITLLVLVRLSVAQ